MAPNGILDTATIVDYYDGHTPGAETFHYIATWSEETAALATLARTARCQYIVGEGRTAHGQRTVACCGAESDRTYQYRDADGRFGDTARYCEVHFGMLYEGGDVTGWMADGLWRMPESRHWYAIGV